MAIHKISSELRKNLKRSNTNALRREGKIPAIYYFHNEEPISITVDSHEFHMGLQTGAHIFDLQLGDKRHKSIIKEIQYDPVSEEPIHVDFMGVDLKESIHINIPIHLHGEPVGVKTFGGVLNQHLWQLNIKCRVSDIPDSVELDVSDLDLGDSINVSDISIEAGEILDAPERSIVSVVQPTGLPVVEEEEEELEEEELAEGEETEGEAAEGEGEETGEETEGKPEEK